MQALKLVKRRSSGYHGGREVHAYGAEFDTDKIAESIKKNWDDGTLTQDSLRFGDDITVGFQISSPIRHDQDTGKIHFSVPSLSVWVKASLPKPDPYSGYIPPCVLDPNTFCE